MTLPLIAAAVLFAAVFFIISLIKALKRSERISFWDVLLVFLVTLLPVSALLAMDATTAAGFDTERAVRLLGIGLIGASVLIALIELLRPARLRRSRGVFGLFAGLLLVVSSFSVPFVSAYFTLSALPTAAPEAVAAAPTGEATLEVEGVVSVERVRAEQLFKAIRQVLAEEINVSEVEVFTQLDAGVPLADVVERNGGDVERVQTRLSEILRVAVRASAERGEISLLQGALLVSQMDLFVRFAVNSNLNSFRGFGGPNPTGTQTSLLILLTEAPLAPADALVTNTPAATAPAATATTTAVPSRTTRPSVTPLPTRTARPTRTPFLTRTPEPTPTASVTCIAVVNFNLRLRAEPNENTETLLTIPFATSILLSARSDDGLWVQTEYDDQTGWVMSEYLTLGPNCDSLEMR
ncbi:MAG TPA: SH3 domain-containing protein [Candidatus Limnocylindrales bacterium]|nr:SH3 domain-containing protein [Candidatus Limnocylindrales bacterium]